MPCKGSTFAIAQRIDLKKTRPTVKYGYLTLGRVLNPRFHLSYPSLLLGISLFLPFKLGFFDSARPPSLKLRRVKGSRLVAATIA